MAGNEEKDDKTVWEKPPLGLMPRNIHDKRRMCDILQAMCNFVGADYKFPPEWIDELNDLNNSTY